jgi:hypothetical protein
MKEVLERVLAAEAVAGRELEAIPDWLWDGETLPVPVETIADSHYGLLIREEDELWTAAGSVEMHISGLLFPSLREIWVDAVESRRAPARRRFTVGHEVGHWVIHCDLGQIASEGVVHCREETLREEAAVEKDQSGVHLADFARYPPPELDANQFAAALLMPAPLVRDQLARVGERGSRLAKAFGVSQIAMDRRLWFLREVEALDSP